MGCTGDMSAPPRPGLSRCGPCLTEPRGPALRRVRGMSNFWRELRRGLDGASTPGTVFASCSLAANTFAPTGDVAGVGRRLLSLLPRKQLLGVPVYSLHPLQHLGEKAVRGEVSSAPGLSPGLSPTTERLSPESPTCFSSPPKYHSPSTLLLFFHFIFRSAAPVSSFLFVFHSYYSWLLPVFWFPSSDLIRMFILAACFYTFPRCLLVVAGQRSVFGLGRHSRVAGLGPAAGPSPQKPSWSRRGEDLVLQPAFLPALFLTWSS